MESKRSHETKKKQRGKKIVSFIKILLYIEAMTINGWYELNFDYVSIWLILRNSAEKNIRLNVWSEMLTV